MKLSEYQRSRSFFDQGSKVTQISKLKLVFLKNSRAIWNQSSYESLKGNRNENLYKRVGSHDQHGRHAIYGKNLKKSSTPEPIDWWPWNLVCSIVCGSSTKFVQIITLGWPCPILRQGQIWSHRLLYGKKWKLYFLLKLLQPWVSNLLETFS